MCLGDQIIGTLENPLHNLTYLYKTTPVKVDAQKQIYLNVDAYVQEMTGLNLTQFQVFDEAYLDRKKGTRKRYQEMRTQGDTAVF